MKEAENNLIRETVKSFSSAETISTSDCAYRIIYDTHACHYARLVNFAEALLQEIAASSEDARNSAAVKRARLILNK